MQDAIFTLDDGQLENLISNAANRIVFVAPGISTEVASAICAAWERLGANSVAVVLDLDSDVFRLGYGDIQAVKLLQLKAAEINTVVSRQKGIRIGFLIADEQVVIFSPTPHLILGSSSSSNLPNAIFLDRIPSNLGKDAGIGERGIADQKIGLEKAHSKDVEEVESDLQANPPMKLDVAKTMILFNSTLEFVEIELKNCLISRKEVPIKSDLFGLVQGDKAYDNLRSSFKLISKSSSISEKKIVDRKNEIVKKYLISLKGYGNVILRSKKEAFNREVQDLKDQIKKFQLGIEQNLNNEIGRNRKTLVRALLPAVQKRPPERWSKFLSTGDKKQRTAEIESLLEDELNTAFESAKKDIVEMDVTVIYKGVTYELLKNSEFLAVAKKAIPMMKSLHWEGRGVLSQP